MAFSTATSSFMQMATEQPMRGRVASIRLAVGLGGTPIGAPIMGWLADQFGPRMSMGAGAISGVLAAAGRERRARLGRLAFQPSTVGCCDASRKRAKPRERRIVRGTPLKALASEVNGIAGEGEATTTVVLAIARACHAAG